MIAPVVEQAAQEVGDGVKFFDIDVDKNQETAAKYNVMSIPALVFFKEGKEVNRLAIANKDQIAEAAEALKN